MPEVVGGILRRIGVVARLLLHHPLLLEMTSIPAMLHSGYTSVQEPGPRLQRQPPHPDQPVLLPLVWATEAVQMRR